MLLANRLPEGPECVLCGMTTVHCISYQTICEYAHVETGDRPKWQIVLATVTLGWLVGLLLSRDRRAPREVGRDRVFTLPLRVCPGCGSGLTTKQAIKDAMARVPVYRRLLTKYPDAQIDIPGT